MKGSNNPPELGIPIVTIVSVRKWGLRSSTTCSRPHRVENPEFQPVHLASNLWGCFCFVLVVLWVFVFVFHSFWLGLTCGLRRRQWQPTPVLLPGKSHGRRSLVGCSPRGHKESDMTEQLHFHFSLACIGEGNGNPLQCSCLENPRDRGAWWAAIYGVAQSRTRLKRLSSSIHHVYLKFNIQKLNS